MPCLSILYTYIYIYIYIHIYKLYYIYYIYIYVYIYILRVFISDPRHTQSVTKSNRGKVDVIHICNHENNVRALPVITTMALWQLMHLSTWCTCTNYHKCHWEGLLLSWLTIYKYIFLYTYMYIYIHILYAYIYIYIYI